MPPAAWRRARPSGGVTGRRRVGGVIGSSAAASIKHGESCRVGITCAGAGGCGNETAVWRRRVGGKPAAAAQCATAARSHAGARPAAGLGRPARAAPVGRWLKPWQVLNLRPCHAGSASLGGGALEVSNQIHALLRLLQPSKHHLGACRGRKARRCLAGSTAAAGCDAASRLLRMAPFATTVQQASLPSL